MRRTGCADSTPLIPRPMKMGGVYMREFCRVVRDSVWDDTPAIPFRMSSEDGARYWASPLRRGRGKQRIYPRDSEVPGAWVCLYRAEASESALRRKPRLRLYPRYSRI